MVVLEEESLKYWMSTPGAKALGMRGILQVLAVGFCCWKKESEESQNVTRSRKTTECDFWGWIMIQSRGPFARGDTDFERGSVSVSVISGQSNLTTNIFRLIG